MTSAKYKSTFEKTCPPTYQNYRIIIGFITVYILSAVWFQLNSDIPPWKDRSPIEYFEAGVLLMSSLVFFSIGYMHLQYSKSKSIKIWKMVLFSCIAIALSVLAADELFQLHERTAAVGETNDPIQILQFIVAGIGLYFIAKIEKASKDTMIV